MKIGYKVQFSPSVWGIYDDRWDAERAAKRYGVSVQIISEEIDEARRIAANANRGPRAYRNIKVEGGV